MGSALTWYYQKPWLRSEDNAHIPSLQVSWQYYVGISNILVDLLILIRGLLLVFRVQASLGKRLVFATVFLPRIL